MLARTVSSTLNVLEGATDTSSANGRQGADILDYG